MMRRVVVYLSIVCSICSAAVFSASPDDESVVRNLVEDMNIAMLEQDLDRCLSYFAEDTDFENSLGWRTSSREALGRFLGDYLFKKYPPTDLDRYHSQLTVEFLSPVIAQVEQAKRIESADENIPTRTARTSYIVENRSGQWQIISTRSWVPRVVDNPPSEYVEPTRFPGIINDG